MQTERVTFLTTPDHKAALDAFAASRSMSVGHVVREATVSYIARPAAATDEYEEALDLALPEVEAVLAQMGERLDNMRAVIAQTCAAIDAALASDPR